MGTAASFSTTSPTTRNFIISAGATGRSARPGCSTFSPKSRGDRAWLDWVRRSANGLLRSGIPEQETPGFWNNAGICCGLAGVGEFFLDLYRALGDEAYLEFSKRVAARLLAKATVEDGRMSWLQAEHRTRPDYLFAQTGYMQGAAGIGTFLLRLADADRAKIDRIVFPDTPFTR